MRFEVDFSIFDSYFSFKRALKKRLRKGIKRSEAFLFCKSKRKFGVKNPVCELKFTRHKRSEKYKVKSEID